jgi:hypothetical protein
MAETHGIDQRLLLQVRWAACCVVLPRPVARATQHTLLPHVLQARRDVLAALKSGCYAQALACLQRAGVTQGAMVGVFSGVCHLPLHTWTCVIARRPGAQHHCRPDDG